MGGVAGRPTGIGALVAGIAALGAATTGVAANTGRLVAAISN